MKLYKLDNPIRALIFDMDGTLYSHDAYLQSQIDGLINRLAQVRGKTFEETKAALESWQGEKALEQGGRKISLGKALEYFGISVSESVRWREELIEPALYLCEDRELKKTLGLLAEKRPLAVVTNNPVLVARKTLACLDVAEFFSVVIGLDTCGVSKPHKEPFRKAAELLGVPSEACVSVGDRYDIDIALSLELGMGGILVDGVEDVYALPRLAALR
ncbi:MAG: HAD family hydrolase [Treponema sp.]|nr:HAD family hydrolase [Treponema sp.]